MSDKMREALERIVAVPVGMVDTSYRMRLIAKIALAEQPAQGEALKPGQYVIEYNGDGEFGQATGWLYRDGGYPCVVTGKPVYVWRRLRDLIGKPPAPAVPDDVAKERDRCITIVENYQVPIGNSAAGEMARDWTSESARAEAAEAKLRELANTQPVVILHTGSVFGGEQDEWEFEVDRQADLAEFCSSNPGQKIALIPRPEMPS